MKKVMLLATVAAALISCNDDDNNTPVSGLNGTWKLTALTAENQVDLNQDGTASGNLISETGCYDNSTLVLQSTNSAVLNMQEFGIDINTQEFTCTAQPAQTGTFVDNGSTVTVTIAGEPVVLTKSGNTLSSTEETEEFGTMTLEFTKQ